MIEDLEKSLKRFDADTIGFLENNKTEIFRSIAINCGIPSEIGETLRKITLQREVIVEAINKLEVLHKEQV